MSIIIEVFPSKNYEMNTFPNPIDESIIDENDYVTYR